MGFFDFFRGKASTDAAAQSTNSSPSFQLEMLLASEMMVGGQPSYELCKAIFRDHPLGRKIASALPDVVLSKPKRYTVDCQFCPDEALRAFNKKWKEMGINETIRTLYIMSRIYGVSAVVLATDGDVNSLYTPLDLKTLHSKTIKLAVYDPMILSGSFTNNQNPMSFNFLETNWVKVQGRPVDAGRAVVLCNTDPLYLQYTNSVFGYAGTSVYSACLRALKLYLQLSLTQERVCLKIGSMVIKKDADRESTTHDSAQQRRNAWERGLVSQMSSGDVLTLGGGSSLDTFDMKNSGETLRIVYELVMNEIASASSVPAKLLLNDSYAGVLANGSEDLKQTMMFVEHERHKLEAVYRFFERIVAACAWTPEFYQHIYAIKTAENKDLTVGKTYDGSFVEWTEGLTGDWQDLVDSPLREKVELAKAKVDTAVSILAQSRFCGFLSNAENARAYADWFQRQINASDEMFDSEIVLHTALIEPIAGVGGGDEDAAG